MLLLARHGQTAANARGLLLGRADPPLTAFGRLQAAALGRVPSVRSAVRVVASPARRCRETAEAMALGVPVTVDERWIEMDYGDWDGRAITDVPAGEWARWRADPTWAPPGGESIAAVGVRVRSALGDLVAEAVHGDVVVVSHVSPLKAALAWALGTGDEVAWRIHLDVACLSRCSLDPPVVRSVNEVAHLPPSP